MDLRIEYRPRPSTSASTISTISEQWLECDKPDKKTKSKKKSSKSDNQPPLFIKGESSAFLEDLMKMKVYRIMPASRINHAAQYLSEVASYVPPGGVPVPQLESAIRSGPFGFLEEVTSYHSTDVLIEPEAIDPFGLPTRSELSAFMEEFSRHAQQMQESLFGSNDRTQSPARRTKNQPKDKDRNILLADRIIVYPNFEGIKGLEFARKKDVKYPKKPKKNECNHHMDMKSDEKVKHVRIAILGSPDVGKSALAVRYLTKRFIGEYQKDTDLMYKQLLSIDNSLYKIEMADLSDSKMSSFPVETINWADGVMIVYDVSSTSSFHNACNLVVEVNRRKPNLSKMLLGNKCDLVCSKEVETYKGKLFASRMNCGFFEVSARDATCESTNASFKWLLKEIRDNRNSSKLRKFSVSKMWESLMNSTTKIQMDPKTSSVTECKDVDLNRSRIIRRRQNFTATASL